MQYRERRRTGIEKNLRISELRILVAKELDKAWKEICASNMIESAFSNVGLTLKIDGSEDHKMKFQGQPPGKPDSIVI